MMTQVLHIFRKDVRHLWIELTASLLADAAYIAKVLTDWHRPDRPEFLPGFLSGLLRFLVPFAWCLLVARSVQDESLVGDRQFWITRPYTWRELLAAKFLFALVFIHLPLLICNCIFLVESGFSPLAHVPGLLWIQLSLLMVLVLTTATVSVVTPTIVQAVLWVVGIAVYTGTLASLDRFMPGAAIATVPSVFDWLPVATFAAACMAIVLWQYSQRRVWVARLAIVLIAAVCAGVQFIPQSPSEVTRAYPPLATAEQPPFHASPADPSLKSSADPSAFAAKTVALVFPLSVSGVAQGSLVNLTGRHVTIHLRDGKEWNSKWEPNYDEVWPSSSSTYLELAVDRKFFEESKFVPASVGISLAYTEYREENPRQIVVKPGIFPVDGVGLCWSRNSRFVEFNSSALECRAPLTSPKLLARYDTAASTCAIRSDRVAPPPSTRYTALLNDDGYTPFPAIIPIANFNIGFAGPDMLPDEKTQIPGVCVGTPVTISTPIVVQMRRTDVMLDGVDLADYVRRTNPSNFFWMAPSIHVR
jgi:hypothetical protein